MLQQLAFLMEWSFCNLMQAPLHGFIKVFLNFKADLFHSKEHLFSSWNEKIARMESEQFWYILLDYRITKLNVSSGKQMRTVSW